MRSRFGRIVTSVPGQGSLSNENVWSVPRRPSLSLWCVAALLVVVGTSGIALAAMLLETSVAVMIGHTDLLLVHPNNTLDVILNWVKPLPGLAILCGSVTSLWVARAVIGGRWTRRRGRRVVAVGVAFALDAILILPLHTILAPGAPHPAYGKTAPVLDDARFIEDGTIGQPASNQPSRPVAVDRVLADGAATYVQYHIADVPHDGQPTPALVDDRGDLYAVDVVPAVVMTPEEFVRQMMPWRAPVQELATFPPLRPGVRSVALRFTDRLSRVVQTVRVPLNHPAGPGPLTVRVVSTRDATMTLHMAWGIATIRLTLSTMVHRQLVPTSGLSSALPNGPFATVRGQPLAPLDWGSTCRTASTGAARCETWATFALLPPATRITVAASGITLYDQNGNGRSISWPVRPVFTTPMVKR